ncbi:hypothetical protein PHLGIDRAFT_238192 [Phlebiopsis gigantea 11061_1 CR5-6]|uniref:Uncharacterized protein n=1 Tax=Phlebiopsis gigantea (strain 11061_1 CR5-6) TaxID=745531 RepID=A0A0C3PDP2_PHLG1|nr:hypothetical protein PHLGIDRAFT_238192 [Phlebiopsis gigantea 11061_1 CR5-6]
MKFVALSYLSIIQLERIRGEQCIRTTHPFNKISNSTAPWLYCRRSAITPAARREDARDYCSQRVGGTPSSRQPRGRSPGLVMEIQRVTSWNGKTGPLAEICRGERLRSPRSRYVCDPSREPSQCSVYARSASLVQLFLDPSTPREHTPTARGVPRKWYALAPSPRSALYSPVRIRCMCATQRSPDRGRYAPTTRLLARPAIRMLVRPAALASTHAPSSFAPHSTPHSSGPYSTQVTEPSLPPRSHCTDGRARRGPQGIKIQFNAPLGDDGCADAYIANTASTSRPSPDGGGLLPASCITASALVRRSIRAAALTHSLRTIEVPAP